MSDRTPRDVLAKRTAQVVAMRTALHGGDSGEFVAMLKDTDRLELEEVLVSALALISSLARTVDRLTPDDAPPILEVIATEAAKDIP